MNGRTGTEDVRLRGLVDTLEDCRQFYLSAIPGSSGEIRPLNAKKADCFAVMLAEIGQWQAHHHDPVVATAGQAPPLAFAAQSSGPDPREPHTCDDFSALLHHINCIHDKLFPTSLPQTSARALGSREGADSAASPAPFAAHPAHEEPERHRFHGCSIPQRPPANVMERCQGQFE